jgi:hypothetical protein
MESEGRKDAAVNRIHLTSQRPGPQKGFLTKKLSEKLKSDFLK